MKTSRSRTSSRWLAILMVLCMLLSCVSNFSIFAEDTGESEVTVESKLLLEEDFDYEAGVLHGLNGGVGWSNHWEVAQEADSVGYAITSSNPMEYGSLKVSTTYATGGYAYRGTGRLMDLSSTGNFADYIKESSGQIGKTGTTLWLSSLYRVQSTGNSFFALSNYNFPYHHANNQGIGFGRINNASSEYLSMSAYTSGTGNAVATAVSDVPIKLNETVFYVIKLSFVSDTETKVDCYINPDILSEPTGEPDMSMTVTNFDSSFKVFGFEPGISNDYGTIDAIRMGTDYRAVVPLKTLEERKESTVAKWSTYYNGLNRARYTEENLAVIDGYNADCLAEINQITEETKDAEIDEIVEKYIALVKSVERIVTFYDGALVRRAWTNVSDGNIAALENFIADSRYIENNYDLVKVIETNTKYSEEVGNYHVASHIGYIRAPQTGTYTFRIQGSDDAVRLDINGEKVAYYDGYSANINQTDVSSSAVCEVNLVAGQRTPIDIMYKEASGGDLAWIQWKGPGISDSFVEIEPKYLSCSEEYLKDADLDLLDGIQGVYPEIFLTVNEMGTVAGYDPTGYQLNEEVTLTATTVDENTYYFVGWKVDGEDKGSNASITLTMDKDYEVEAIFDYKSVEDLKVWAKAELLRYSTVDTYREEQQTELDAILADANSAIDEATTIDSINEIVDATKLLIDDVPTDDELCRQELEPYATQIIAQLNEDASFDSYRTAERAQVQTLVDEATADIKLATTQEAIDAIYTTTMAAIAEIPTDAELTAEEKALATAKESAIDELNAYKSDVYNLYYQEQQDEMNSLKQAGVAAINAAETIDVVNTALSSAKSSINVVLTAEMTDFVNTYSDTSGGLLAYDGFVGNIGSIGTTNTGVGFNGGYTYEAGGGVDHMAISTENPLTYDNLLSSPKYLTYLKSYYSTARTFNTSSSGPFGQAGVLSDGLIGVNNSNQPIYYSALLRIGTSGRNMLQFHAGPWFWHDNARKFAVGYLKAEDGLSEDSTGEDGNKYWALRTYNDRDGTAKIVRTNKVIDKTEAVFVVVKVDFNYDSSTSSSESKVSLYLNPDLTAELPETPDAQIVADNDLRFKTISQLESNRELELDEVRVGTSFEAVAPLGNCKLPITKVKVTGDAATIAGGTIMGSNESATSAFDIIAQIPDDNTSDTVELSDIINANSYRYVKFYGNAGTYGKVSELEFYSGTRKLSGEPFGTVSSEGHGAEMAFDGDAETYYEGQVADDQYVGLDLGGETTVATPYSNATPGRYEEAIEVDLECDTEGADIYYTLDGTAPSRTNGTLYSEPIQLNVGDSVLVKAIAVKQGLYDSKMFAAGYGIGTEAPVAEGMAVYMLGNSLTDTVANGMLTNIAQSSGYAHDTFRKSIPGAAIVYHYSHKNAGFGYPWITDPGEVSTEQTDEFSMLYYQEDDGTQHFVNPDKARYAAQDLAPLDVLTLQPFNNGDYYDSAEQNNVIETSKYFYESAKKYNPDLRLVLYSSWGSLRNDEYTDAFDRTNNSYNAMNENMARDLNEIYPDGPEVTVVPNIQALVELKRQIQAGEFPGGVTDFAEFTAADAETDALHLSVNGQYLIGLTTYVTLYKTTPVGKVTYKPDSLTDEQALALQKIAYDVNINYEYSGVSATDTEKPTPEPTVEPTATPELTPEPTEQPVVPTEEPVIPTEAPAESTVEPTPEVTPESTSEPTQAPNVNVIKNGDFSKGIANWDVSSLGDYSVEDTAYNYEKVFKIPANTGGSLTQAVSVVPGATYTLKYRYYTENGRDVSIYSYNPLKGSTHKRITGNNWHAVSDSLQSREIGPIDSSSNRTEYISAEGDMLLISFPSGDSDFYLDNVELIGPAPAEDKAAEQMYNNMLVDAEWMYENEAGVSIDENDVIKMSKTYDASNGSWTDCSGYVYKWAKVVPGRKYIGAGWKMCNQSQLFHLELWTVDENGELLKKISDNNWQSTNSWNFYGIGSNGKSDDRNNAYTVPSDVYGLAVVGRAAGGNYDATTTVETSFKDFGLYDVTESFAFDANDIPTGTNATVNGKTINVVADSAEVTLDIASDDGSRVEYYADDDCTEAISSTVTGLDAEDKVVYAKVYTYLNARYRVYTVNVSMDDSGEPIPEPTVKPTAEPTPEATPTPMVEYVTVEYKDINNNTAKSVDVVKGEAIGTLPKMFRDGYVFEGWYLGTDKVDETLVVDDAIVLKPKFVKEENYSNTYTIVLGENATYSKINGFDYVDGMEAELTFADKVVLKMKEAEGKEVDYWTINGQVISNDQTLSFMVQPGEMNVDVVLKEVGVANTKTVDPNVIITSTVSRPDHNNRFYVYSMRVIEDPSKVVECGVIILSGTNADEMPDFTLETNGIHQIKSSRQGSMGEYAIVRKDTETQYSVRSYMKYVDDDGNEHIVYSDAVTVLLDVVQ